MASASLLASRKCLATLKSAGRAEVRSGKPGGHGPAPWGVDHRRSGKEGVGDGFRLCVCTGAVEQAAGFVERGVVQLGRVWSRSLPINHVDDCERRVRMSEAAKPGPGRAM
jgi:hypothetical protein